MPRLLTMVSFRNCLVVRNASYSFAARTGSATHADGIRFPKPWRLRGALFWKNSDLAAHEARVAAALAAPVEADALA